MSKLNVVGQYTDAVGSRSVITGKAVYCPDIELPGMLVGKLLYSEYPSARILKLDVKKACAMTGVIARFSLNIDSHLRHFFPQ